MELPVVAEVGVIVSLLNVLAVGEVTVVGVVLSIVHIYRHRVPYFRQTMVLLKINNHLFNTYYILLNVSTFIKSLILSQNKWRYL